MRYESGKVYVVRLQDWYVVEPPIWENHSRARNWLARIAEDPNAPGGLTREWCERGRGRLRYSAAALLEEDTIEFGADRIWADGAGRCRERWVGEIVKITDAALHIRYFDSAEEMFQVIQDRESRIQEAQA